MVQELAIPLYEEIESGFNKLLSEQGSPKQESNSLRQARLSAFERFKEMGFPTTKNEDWKYTNITRFLKDEFTIAGTDHSAAGKDTPIEEPVAAILEQSVIDSLDCYRIVLVNGAWRGKQAGEQYPSGVQLFTVAEARLDPAFSGYFERSNEFEKNHFAALNAALSTDGLFIRVDAGAAPDKPLHIVHVYTSTHNLLVQPRHVVLVNKNASLSIIESVMSEDGNSKIFVNSLMEIVVQPDARMDHTIIQASGKALRLIQHITVRQRRQSLYNNFTFTFPGADLVRNELSVRLEEEHTESHLYGLYLLGGQQLVDNHTLVDHQKPSCHSNELYKGVLLERSVGVFNGKVYVHKDAQKTNAFQQNNNLVISKKATINSKPQLEIFADDVKCSHGSTVGQFSEEALFYLRARGIGEETAKALLINAFAFDITEKINIPALRAHINHLIEDQIPVTTEDLV
ncbi:MAG TPA: Fe-S cluster assembly protein SufD [Puia sp.]|nr:Fe-S cluster assembly protein SufD [Puia sp.]